jgi:hypothetical protein
MSEPDWITLWILNRTVIMECSLHNVIRDVMTEHFGFWSFPAHSVYVAEESVRIEALKDCIDRGLVEIVTDSWLQDSQVSDRCALSIEQCDFSDPLFLKQTYVMATLEGHSYWELEFQPDWRRYWHSEGISDRLSEEAILHVIYAGNEIYEELIRLLPDYFGYDANFGVKTINCNTSFQYQVTKWKILPAVKVATWKIKRDDSLKIIAELATTASDQDKAALKLEMNSCMEKAAKRQIEARRVLSRLSKRWDVVALSNGGRQDSIAIPLKKGM